ncbi:hypothetical protein RRG08_036566 [Elysia crispata]|uniref:Uncharacterized protein n=1 Tax=Elysia crispata TaxID=231223 RepID=A0AAE0ZRZ3_9GAST|nr:hypothetical protein RRG08_036566 [Elysia crispata]
MKIVTTTTPPSPQPSGTGALKTASTVLTSSSTAPGSLSVATERKITRPCPLRCRCSENQADCSNLNLNEIPENLNMAEIVDLHGNNIKILNPATLSSLVDVVTLDLSDNSISNISEPVFSNMSQLKHLMVSHNPLNILSPAVFKDLPQLLSLEVDFTRFKPVPGLFNGLTKLRRLNLRGNELKTLDEILGQDGHASLPLLHHLDLSYNLLESLPQDIFQLHSELKSVRLVHNSWRCDQNLLFLSQAMRKSPHMFSLGHKVLCSTPENLKGKKVAQFNEDLLVTPTAMLPAVSKMSSSEPGKQDTATSPSPTTEEGDLPKHPTSVSGRTGVNLTTIIIVSVTGVLILVICLLVLIIVIRYLRKWKRVYKVHKKQKINAIIDYNRMDSSSDCDSLAHITILNSCHTEEGKGGVQIVSDATDKSLLIKTKTGHSTVEA